MRYDTVIYRVSEGIGEIRFNRPQRLNAVIEDLYREVLLALDAAEQDTKVRVIVLTGEGRAFCVGADLKEHGRGERSAFDKRNYLLLANEVCARIHTHKKPVIAAVNGYALGAGAEMALSSDFILMKDSAQIGFPEISIGTHVGGAITLLLPRLVGLAKARELIFTGERIKGKEALRIGLASRAFKDETFGQDVNAFAQLLASKAPVSASLAKQHLNLGYARDYQTALLAELEAITACMATEDWQEGIDAFAAKRAPVFRGR